MPTPALLPTHELPHPADRAALAQAAELLDAGAPIPPHTGPLLARLLRAPLPATPPAPPGRGA
ncbi:hypothetical protein LZF96_26305, partial [Streptomyces sp. ST2-7A]|nr:hypothetical protein [Streptomyces sp. ST2-7A]